MYQTTDFHKGLKIEYKNEAYNIVEFQHVNPGKGSAFVRTKIKNLATGKVLDVTFKAGVDTVGIPDLATHQMQYLYFDGEIYTFMDTESYDQIPLSEEDIGEAKDFLVENSVVKVTYYKGKAIGVEMDNFVDLKVKDTPPNIKGDTSSGGGKPATMETGLTVQVPFHINIGDTLKIDTRFKKYVEKVR